MYSTYYKQFISVLLVLLVQLYTPVIYINQGFNFIPFSTDGQILNKSISKLNLKKYI